MAWNAWALAVVVEALVILALWLHHRRYVAKNPPHYTRFFDDRALRMVEHVDPGMVQRYRRACRLEYATRLLWGIGADEDVVAGGGVIRKALRPRSWREDLAEDGW